VLVSTEVKKFSQHRVLYAEIRDSIGVTCKRSTKSLEQTSIRKVYEQRYPLVSF